MSKISDTHTSRAFQADVTLNRTRIPDYLNMTSGSYIALAEEVCGTIKGAYTEDDMRCQVESIR